MVTEEVEEEEYEITDFDDWLIDFLHNKILVFIPVTRNKSVIYYQRYHFLLCRLQRCLSVVLQAPVKYRLNQCAFIFCHGKALCFMLITNFNWRFDYKTMSCSWQIVGLAWGRSGVQIQTTTDCSKFKQVVTVPLPNACQRFKCHWLLEIALRMDVPCQNRYGTQKVLAVCVERENLQPFTAMALI